MWKDLKLSIKLPVIKSTREQWWPSRSKDQGPLLFSWNNVRLSCSDEKEEHISTEIGWILVRKIEEYDSPLVSWVTPNLPCSLPCTPKHGCSVGMCLPFLLWPPDTATLPLKSLDRFSSSDPGTKHPQLRSDPILLLQIHYQVLTFTHYDFGHTDDTLHFS